MSAGQVPQRRHLRRPHEHCLRRWARWWWRAASAVALAFGLVAAQDQLLHHGGLSDIVNMGHWGRMRMWMLAVAVAIIGATALAASGQVDLAKAVPQRPNCPGCRCWSAAWCSAWA
jgi:hypothetical protein